MLGRKYKIHKKKEVEAVFKKGRSSFDNILGVKTLPTDNDRNRFVIVVSGKVSKKAVVRNALKRRLSELCRINLATLAPGNDFFILALPPAAKKTYQELGRSLLWHFKRLGT